MYKEKITQRIDTMFQLMKNLSSDVEASVSNIKNITDKTEQMQVAIKYDMLKGALSNFFLLVEILETDLETPLAEHSKEISEYRDNLVKVAESINKPENKTQIQNNFDKFSKN